MEHSNGRYTSVLYFSLQAFEIAEKEFGILPVMSPQDMATIEVPDKLTMVSYLSQFYEYFRKDVAAATITKSETFLFLINDYHTRKCNLFCAVNVRKTWNDFLSFLIPESKSPESILQPSTKKFRSPRPKSPSSKLSMLNNISNRIRARRVSYTYTVIFCLS